MLPPGDADAKLLRGLHHDDVGDAADDEQVAGQRARQGQHRPGQRVRRRREQQHHCGHVRDQVGQHHRRCRTAAGARCRSIPGAVSLRHGLLQHPGGLQGMVDDEQADEQHQQLPVDQPEHASRMHPSGAQQQPGSRQREHLARDRGRSGTR